MFDTGEDHGRIVAGEGKDKGKGKGHGPGALLHGPHATEILVISSVAGVLLMWLTFRNSGGSSAAAAPAPGVSPTGISAGDVAGFDQASVQGLTDNLQTFQQANAAAFQSLTDGISNQTTAINNGFSALPQQIASVIPHAQVNVPAPVTQAPAPAPSAAPAAGPGQFYTVKSGDNLSTIASWYPQASITAHSIAALNGIRNINLIHPGDQLRIY